jgi:translation initiation factor IF-1
MPKFTFKSNVRVAADGEDYAIVIRRLGNGNVLVKLKNATERICTIRQKFNRKNKEVIDVGTWLLVADRDYSTKKTHCDMLEVYSKHEINKLMELSNDWAVFTGEDPEEVHTDYDAIVTTDVVMDIDFDDI